jgi:hypothetical protein
MFGGRGWLRLQPRHGTVAPVLVANCPGANHLEDNNAIETDLPGKVHYSHPTFSNLPEQFVIGESLSGQISNLRCGALDEIVARCQISKTARTKSLRRVTRQWRSARRTDRRSVGYSCAGR